VKLAVQLFAQARDLAGRDRIELELDEPASVGDVRTALARLVPALAGLAPQLFISIGTEYADDETSVAARDTIACFPPVSGG